MTIAKRGTLLIVTGPYHDPDRMHLHVVCADPNENDLTVVVPICTYSQPYHDDTCVLQPHEHNWLRHDSYVLYRRAEVVSVTGLQRGIEAGRIEARDPINAQAFLRVRNGICRSPQTEPVVKKFMNCPDPQAKAPA